MDEKKTENTNNLDQIRNRQKTLEKNQKKIKEISKIYTSFPPFDRDLITRIIYNQNKLLLKEIESKDNKYLKISYCVPEINSKFQ